MRRSTTLALVLLSGLVGCVTATDGEAEADPTPAATAARPARDPDRTARGSAAGLTPAQADTLATLGYPILVPAAPGVFRPVRVTMEWDPMPMYVLTYRRDDGGCITVGGMTEGMESLAFPAQAREVGVPAVGRTFTLFDAGQSELSDDAENWGVGTAVSDWFDLDGLFTNVITRADSEASCMPVSLDDLATFAASLRPLDGADDAGIDAAWDNLEIVGEEEELGLFGGQDAEEAATRLYARPEEVREVGVETVRETPHRAVVMVTRQGLQDDSVRDERLRVVYTRARSGDDWQPVRLRRQHRCQQGRGHADWSNEACQ
jgi:hypothetical protein